MLFTLYSISGSSFPLSWILPLSLKIPLCFLRYGLSPWPHSGSSEPSSRWGLNLGLQGLYPRHSTKSLELTLAQFLTAQSSVSALTSLLPPAPPAPRAHPLSSCLRKFKAAKRIHYLFQLTPEERTPISQSLWDHRSLILIRVKVKNPRGPNPLPDATWTPLPPFIPLYHSLF